MPSLTPLTRAMIAASFLAACDAPTLQEAVIIEEPVVALERSAVVETSPVPLPLPTPGNPGRARAGVVTAGDIDDTLNLAAFQRYQSRTAKQLKLAKANLTRPIRTQLIGPSGRPAPGVAVSFYQSGQRTPFHTGYSGVDGRITLFPASMGVGRPSKIEMHATAQDGTSMRQDLHANRQASQATLPFESEWKPDFLDLVFVVDTTGSMQDEIAWLTKELTSVVSRAARSAPGIDIRYGLVVYKAPGDPVVVKNYGFTKSPGQMRRWLKSQDSNGGAGGPEVVARALETAVAMPWRRGQGERLIFQIGDEPPRPDRTKAFLAAAQTAAKSNIQIFGFGASGAEEHFEYLMRQGAALTSGRYVFLTDDSGVGRPHGEPKVACYQVTPLKGLLTRILRSELSGRRVEPSAKEIVRRVGIYNRGVCAN